MAALRPAVFLDRDGVINEDRADYVKNWGEFRFLHGVRQALARLHEIGLPVVIITNQSAVGRGLMTPADIEDIHRKMSRAVELVGGEIQGIYYCPHHPDENCGCRKPRDGLIRQAAVDLNIDLRQSLLIGDTAKDLQAGKKAGCLTVLVLTGQGRDTLSKMFSTRPSFPPDFVCRSLPAAVSLVERLIEEK
jgi:histidinol-phosphate phosphatase family protein